MKRFLALFLAVITVLTMAGCNATGDATTTTAPETTAAPVTEPPKVIKTVVANGASEYAIIRGDSASESDIAQAVRLRAAIEEATGASLTLGTDWIKRDTEVPATGLEIVVGDTNRPQTVEARSTVLRERDFGIFFTGDRVTIVGGSDEATTRAVDYFLANCIDAAAKTISFEEGYTYIEAYQYPLGNVTLDGVSLREFTIVTPANATLVEKSAALALNDYFLAQGGFSLPTADDSAAPAAHELLIGATNREASKKYDATTYGDMEYLLVAEGGSVVLRGSGYQLGGSIGALAAMMKGEKGADVAVTLPKDGKVAKFAFADKATNAVLMIGDGMGELQISLALSKDLDHFTARDFPNQGYAKTYSASDSVTDSAASGTALSSGYKTINRYLGMTPKLATPMNIRELAASKGARTAVVTTDALTGATPAAFTVHVKDRDSTAEIVKQQRALEDIQYLVGKETGGVTSLVKNGREALRTIANGESETFFIMIEEAYIDKHSHSNAGDDVVTTVKQLNDMTTYLSQFIFLHPSTALIVTADHECGGIKQRADGTFMFTSTNHTGVNVPVAAIGPGTEFFNGATVNNIEIAKFMGKIWGEENLGG